MNPIEVRETQERLAAAGGGYEVVHSSPGIEMGVYVLVAPEPDRQQPHEDDEVYVVLEGRGSLEIEDECVELTEGHAVFVPARGARDRGAESARSRLSRLQRRVHLAPRAR